MLVGPIWELCCVLIAQPMCLSGIAKSYGVLPQ
jgi:hypothetical protein